jgi:hypothetical protein
MTVCAKQDALPRFGSCLIKRSGQPTHAQPESFLGGIDVVELKRRNVAVVAAQHATPASFGNKDRLYLASSSGDGF